MVFEELNFLEFQDRFHDEESCRDYIFNMKWPKGYKCSKCRGKDSYYIKTRKVHVCYDCGFQESASRGTVFHNSKVPLRVWFSLIFLMLRAKHGISALSAKRLLGMKNYRTVWLMMQKIRKALSQRDEKYKLSGIIEVDEALFGGKKPGKRGRGAEGRTLVLFAAEKMEYQKNGRSFIKTGFCKARKISKADAETLNDALKGKIAKDSLVETDGWKAYANLKLSHFSHQATVQGKGENASKLFPCVHRLISNMKGNIRGTFHGIKSKYLDYYLGEYVYRYNRRDWENQLFFRGLNVCIQNLPLTLREITT